MDLDGASTMIERVRGVRGETVIWRTNGVKSSVGTVIGRCVWECVGDTKALTKSGMGSLAEARAKAMALVTTPTSRKVEIEPCKPVARGTYAPKSQRGWV